MLKFAVEKRICISKLLEEIIYCFNKEILFMRVLYLVLFVICFSSLYSQDGELSFSHFKSFGDKNVVYFGISGLVNDNEESKRVLEILLEDNLVYDGNIYFTENGKCKCQLDVAITMTVLYIRGLLQSAGYDIDMETVASQSQKKPDGIYNSDFYTFDKSFDAYHNYDPNKSEKSAAEHYAVEKEKWINEHPDEYQNVKTQTSQTVLVKRKDLELFTELKKQHILNHPEIFIIID